MAESAILAVAGLVGLALVLGALASLPGCSAAERQRAEDTAVAVGVTAADCAAALAVTCAVDSLGASGEVTGQTGTDETLDTTLDTTGPPSATVETKSTGSPPTSTVRVRSVSLRHYAAQ